MAAKEAEASSPTLMYDPNGTTFWQHPSYAIQISMPVSSVRTLANKSLRGIRAEEPCELGGILRGTVQRNEQGYLTAFIDPEIISSQSRLYNTTEADFDNIVAAVETARNTGPAVLGYFRSHIRDGLCLSREDELLIQKHFRDPDSIFLLIRPFEIGICMAGFFFWERGRLQTDGSELEVPFVAPEAEEQAQAASRASKLELFQSLAQSLDTSSVPRALCRPAPPSTEFKEENRRTSEETGSRLDETNLALHSEPNHLPAPATEPLPQAPPLAPQKSLGADRPPFPHSRITLKRLALLLSALLVIGPSLYVGFTKSGLFVSFLQKRVSTSEVGLQVRAAPGGQIDLTWDQSSPRLQTAQGATLEIIDGKAHRELYLDKNQLRFGRLTYFSNTGDLQFSLEIHIDNARSITESIRVLPPRVDSAHPPREMATTDPDHMRPESKQSLMQPHSVQQRSTASVTTRNEGHPRDIHIPASPTPGRATTGLRIPGETSVVAQPSLTKVFPPPPLEHLGGGSNNSVPEISVSAVPLPSPPQLDARSPGLNPVERKEAKPAYVPAQPIRQVIPTKPALAPSTIYRAIDIAVQVKIDERGQVTEAHLIRQRSTDATLGTRAISAARQWLFQPAKLHGKNVPSDHTIVFRFRPVD